MTIRKSPRQAIAAYCRGCIYDPLCKGEGNWKDQVEACTITSCELYEHRPVSAKTKCLLKASQAHHPQPIPAQNAFPEHRNEPNFHRNQQ